MSRELEPVVTAEDKRINRISTALGMVILSAGFIVACGGEANSHKDSGESPIIKEQPPGEGYRGPISNDKVLPTVQPPGEGNRDPDLEASTAVEKKPYLNYDIDPATPLIVWK